MSMSMIPDIRLRCRCSGPLIHPDQGVLGSWCGNYADAEDGLCRRCRGHCGPRNQARVLTLDELIERDGASDDNAREG